MTNKVAFLGAMSAVMTALAEPTTRYVDKTGADGAYTSIQAAVDAASAGDTILVRPGEYDNGYKTYTYTDDASVVHTYTNRVTLTKKLYLKATGSAAETVIVGAWDASSGIGIGPAAIRCVYVDSAGEGSVIEGFTLRDGACHARFKADGKTTITDVAPNRGGGIAAHSGRATAYFAVGCVFNHCSGCRGGAMRFGTAIRCRFSGQKAAGSCVARGSTLLNCLIAGNDTDGDILMESKLVNCTVVANGGGGHVCNNKVGLYNTICVGNNACFFTLKEEEPSAALDHSVITTTLTPDVPAKTYFKTIDDASAAAVGQEHVLFAPLFADYRVLAGSVADGLGVAETIAEKISVADAAVTIDLYRDFNGGAIPTSGSIQAGCLQETVSAAGGCACFEGRVTAKGYTVPFTDLTLWAHSTKAVDLFKVSALSQPLYWKTPSMRPPELDGSAYFAIPGAGVTTTNTAYMPKYTYTVAKDGSGDYTTIQAAVDAVPAEGRALISVAAGEYDDVGDVDDTTTGSTGYGSSCVKLKYLVRIVGAGAGKSIIRGRKAATSDGRGSGAARCIRFVNGSEWQIVQGFTLTGGRTTGSSTDDWHVNSGGLALGADSSCTYNLVLDCELTDGYAYRGSAGRYVSFVRCHIHDLAAPAGAIVRPGKLYSCVMESSSGDGYMIDVSNSYLYDSTVVSSAPHLTGTTKDQKIFGEYNTIFLSKATSDRGVALGTNTHGVVCSGKISYLITSGTTPDYSKTSTLFADATGNDYRLLACSPAVTNGWRAARFWEDLCLSDVNGNPRQAVGEAFLPGAVQTVVESLTVAAGKDASVSPSGVVAVEPGESVTISATSQNAVRKIAGFEVDGALVAGDAASWTYTAPADGSWTLGGHTVKALVNTDWFVKPNGDDTADGWTTNTAKRTLAHMMTLTRTGDTVHALPGVYDEGTTNHSAAIIQAGNSLGLSRVLVPTGVTLKGEGGVDETVIAGSAATDNPDAYGCGTNACRCALVFAGGTLTGFTLRDGHTRERDGQKDDCYGGAVLASLGRTAVISQCVISNNVAGRGAVAGGHVIDCRVVGNVATATSGAGYELNATGTYFDDNSLAGTQLLRYARRIENCTFAAGGRQATGGSLFQDSRGEFVNTVVLAPFNSKILASNCTFVAGNYTLKDGSDAASIKEVANAAAAKLDDFGRPAKDSPLVDAANASLAGDGLRANDFFGVQRYYNGAPDIGAYEYDWRGDYAVNLGNGPFVVGLADPQVVATADDKVLIREGALEVVLRDGADIAPKIRIDVEVTGGGTLFVTRGTETLATLTADDGATRLAVRRDAAARDVPFRFAYAKAAADTDAIGALVTSFDARPRGITLICR